MIMKNIYTLLIVLLFAGLGFVNAQTGPGGIGKRDGTSNLTLWLDANNLGLSDGANVTTWADSSGYGNDAAAASGNEPIVKTGMLNSKPVVRFAAGNSDFLTVADDASLNPDEISMIIVSMHTSGSDAWSPYIIKTSSYSWDDGYGFARSNATDDFISFIDSYNTNVVSATYTTNSYDISISVYDKTNIELFKNETSAGTDNYTSSINNSSNSLYIGASPNGANPTAFLDGDIAEIITFSRAINSAERTIVANYLSEKYGISVSTDIFASAGSGYEYDIVGIGQESDGNQLESSSEGFYVESDVASLSAGEYIMFAHNNTANAVSTSDLPTGVAARWARDWYVEKTGSLNSTIKFDMPEGIGGDYPQNISNYVLLYRSGTTGNYAEVTATVNYGDADQVAFDVTDTNLSNGYYTLGTKDQTNSPVEGAPGTTWYTLISGDWNDWNTWTLDPSGALPNNPNHEYPQEASDKVVIKSGKTVTMNLNNLHCASLKVNGRLDLGTTTGHTFDNISGTGRILMAADNFPSYTDCSDFVDAGQDEGTVVYYGSSSYSLNTSYTFFNMEVDMDAGQSVTLLNDYTVNGAFSVTQGTFQINNNTATTNLNITVKGDVYVETTGLIHTGTANARHQFNFYGDFTNKGEVKFTNRSAAVYNSEATDGIVDANFLNDSKDQSISCEGTTNFYRIEIDKGTDATYILNIDASDVSYFNLFGYAHQSHPGTSQLTSNTNALGLLKGTVRIGSNVNVPVLNNTGNYNISAAARLWVDGGSVKETGSALVPYGVIEVSAGLLESKVTSGITTRDNGLIKISGGTINTNVIRTSVLGSGNVGGYVQSGGTVNIAGGSTSTYYHFSMTYPGNTFSMTGGTLHVYDANGTNTNQGGIFIASSPENINVSGGTVIAEIATTPNPFKITSTAPFYNLILRNTNNAITDHVLDAGTNINGNSDADLAAQPIVVLNDFTVESNVMFKHNAKDITIGGNLSIDKNAQLEGNNRGIYYDAGDVNTLKFNGSGNASFYIGYNTSDAIGWEFYCHDFEINKNNLSDTVTILSDTEKDITGYNNRILHIIGDISVQKGVINQGKHSARLFGGVYVYKDGQMGIYEAGTTKLDAYFMLRDGDVVLNTEEGAIFGNTKLNTTGTVTLTSDVYMQRIGFHSGVMNLQTYNLKVDYLHRGATSNNYRKTDGSTSEMIYSDANASDGGISLLITGNGTYCFPLGTKTTTTRYTYAEVIVTDFSDDGYLTVRPVDGELKTTNLSGGDLLDYYWRIGHEGFTTLPTVQYEFSYDNSDVVGNESQYRPGKVLDESPYTRSTDGGTGDVDDTNNLISFDGGGSGFTLEKANYTAGRNNRFTGTVNVYYTNAWYQNWDNAAIWHLDSKTGGTGTVPEEGSIAIIYNDGATGGRIWGNGLVDEPAEVKFEHNYTVNPTPDQENVARLQFNTAGTFDIGKVSGTGMISLNNNANPTVNADWGEFANNPDAFLMYWGANKTHTSIIQPCPSLMLEGSTQQINQDIVINGNLILTGNTNAIPLQNMHIKNNLYVGAWSNGTFHFPGSGSVITVTVDGNLDYTYINSSGNRNVVVDNPGVSTLEHKFIIKGDIIHGSDNDYSLDLFNASDRAAVILELQGENSNRYYRTSTSVPDLYRVILNKGTNQDSTFTFSDDFTLKGATSGVGVDKALELQNGTLILDDTDIAINLSTGDDDFNIPSSAALEVKQGTVNASGNSGILLDGKLKVSDTGTVDMTGGDNYIQYSASGNAEIEVTGGTLQVGSQIRRGSTSTEGVLTYNQSGGMVEIGESAAGTASRGIFEIVNTGSSFIHTGGTFTLVNDLRTNPTIASMYFNPETVSLSAGDTITFGNSNTTSSGNSFTMYAGEALQNLSVNNANTTLTLSIVPCTINENINIGSGTEFDANGLVLTTKGDFTNSGTYTANGNDTYFSGTTDQTITGVTGFYNFYKNTSNTLTLASDVTVTNELHLESGTFDDDGNDLFVQGDMYIDITTLSGASNDGIVANGTSQQNLVGTPSLAKFKTDNANGVFVPTGNEITITGELKMNKGIFDIGQNLMVLTKTADVVEVSSFSESNMVQTNISFTDAGIKKYFPVISSATTFTYPMGSGGKYTPVSLNITNSTNDNTYVRVKAANEIHPSITTTNGDPDNVLKYYWILDADGASGFSGTVTMQAYSGDVQLTGSNSAADYITARLLSRASGTWDKYPTDDFEEGTSELTFTFTNTDDAGIDGDYTAGIDAAIPDQVALYTSIKDGDWTDQTVWSPASPAGGPRGARVLVKHTVTIPDNYKVSYSTQIDNGGELKVNSSFGHRLGNVSGVGTLYMERGDMPAGDYTEFFTVTGGTVEYGGTTTDYDILSEMPEVNNIIVSGSGDRRLPNIEVQLLGYFTINGPDLINEQTQKLSIKKDLNFTSGTYTSKTGANCTVNLNGSSRQNINGSGSFTGTNSFYNFEINNTSGVTLNTDVEIDNNMIFGDGVIFSSSTNTITITNTSTTCVTGGKSTSYVEGPLRKAINNSSSFVFPVGDALRYGEIKTSVDGSSGGTWEAQYYNHSPGDDSMDPTSLSGDIEYVSHGEYWRVEAPANGDAANLLMRWDSNSGVNPNSDFAVAKWTDLATDAWAEVAIGTKTGSSSSGTTNFASDLTFGFDGGDNSHYITFGTISIPSYTWTGTTSTDWFVASNWTNSTLPDASADITIDDVVNDPVISNSTVAQVNDLTINSGATLTLEPGARMTVNGDLTTNDGLIIENSVASPTSFINLGTVTGDAQVEWTYPDNRYMYVGHSVDGVTYSDYSAAITDPVNDLWLYRWPNSWTRITTDVTGSNGMDGTEHALEGYAVKFTEGVDMNISHSGTLRYGSFNQTINGWHLIANPYQAYMDVENTGFDVGNALLPTIWTSTNVSGELVFATYNTALNIGANGGTRYIAPGQSCWVRNYSSSLLSIDPTVRVHATGVLKSGSMAPGDILRITLTNEGLSDEVVLVFRPEGAMEVTNTDSKKRMGSGVEVPNIYTLKDADKLVIGMFPDGGKVDSIYLGYKFSKGKEITFKATNIDEFNVEDKVYLMDKLTNITVDLRETPEYTFTSTKEEDANRLVLIFEQVSTDIDDLGNGSNEDTKVLIYGFGTRAIIKVDKDLLNQAVGEGLISIYTLNGELVNETELLDIRTEINLPECRGIYIVEVRMNSSIVTGKVIKTE